MFSLCKESVIAVGKVVTSKSGYDHGEMEAEEYRYVHRHSDLSFVGDKITVMIDLYYGLLYVY